MKKFYLLILAILLSHFIYAQGGGCSGNALLGVKVLSPGEGQKLISFKIKHTFTLIPFNNFTPDVYAVSFNHAWVKEPVTGCNQYKVKPTTQPVSFQVFGKDTIIFDSPKNPLEKVDTVYQLIGPNGGSRNDAAFSDSCKSRSRANTCVVIDTIKVNSVKGVIQSFGFAQSINPTINTSAYSFSWCGASVTEGKPLKQGDIGWTPVLETYEKGKVRNIRQKAGSNDPINFEVHDYVTGLDTAGTLLTISMRYQIEDDTVDINNYWRNDTVHIESDSILFKIDFPTPFTASQGFIYLLVQNGLVVQSQKTGVFNSVLLPSPGTPVPFSFPFNNTINFHYNLDTSGLFNNDSIKVKLLMFGNNENHEIISYDTLDIFPIDIPPSCTGGNDGAISLYLNFGISPYSYIWNNGATTAGLTNLSAGTYTVTVTDFLGTIASKTIFLSDPPLLSVSGITIPVTCKGASNGSITLSVAGGSPPYTYLWNNGSTNSVRNGLGPNTYTVVVTDSKGCFTTASFTIVQSPTTLIISTSKNNVRCFGKCTGKANVFPSGGTPPYSYLWNTGAITSNISALCAGSYTCTVTDAFGCAKTKAFVITQPSPLVILVTPNDPTTASMIVTGGTPGYTYKWFTVPIQTTATATGLVGGTVYQVKVTDSYNCTKTSLFTMPLIRGSVKEKEKTDLHIYPNPCSEKLYIYSSDKADEPTFIELLDMMGRKIWKGTLVHDLVLTDIKSLQEGVYLLKHTDKNKIKVYKIVVQRPSE